MVPTITVTINGKEVEIEEGTSITKSLVDQGVDHPHHVFVELNGDVIDWERYDNTILTDCDTVEFLYGMSGGSNG